MQYSLCNEPWLKYTMGVIADRGLRPSQWTSARLLTEVLFLETHRERFEVSRAAGPADERGDAFRLCRCRRVLPLRGIRKHGLPTPAELVEPVFEDARWEEFRWSTTGLSIRGKEYAVARILMVPIKEEPPAPEGKGEGEARGGDAAPAEGAAAPGGEAAPAEGAAGAGAAAGEAGTTA